MNAIMAKAILHVAAEEAYQREVVEPLMEPHIIGEGKECASKEDWIQARIAGWVLEARRLIRSGAFSG